MTNASMNAASSGLFATARKGALSNDEIREIEAHRATDRPTPWSALAKRYGRCEADLRAHFAPKLPAPPPPAVTAGEALASALRAGAAMVGGEDAQKLLSLAADLEARQ